MERERLVLENLTVLVKFYSLSKKEKKSWMVLFQRRILVN